MPTPMFNVRLSLETQHSLKEFAKVYGAPTASAFARDVLTVMCSGDAAQIMAFNRRLIMAAGEQLTLKLDAIAQDVMAQPKKPPVKRKLKRRTRAPAP